MSGISTHILDLTTGKPAAGIAVALERKSHTAGWQQIGRDLTDAEGRIGKMLPMGEVFLPGHYRMTFETGPYFLLMGVEPFYPQITIAFTVKDAAQDFQIPLRLSAFSYSTNRG